MKRWPGASSERGPVQGIPTLRLFRWKPWAISLGYNQNAADLDAARCAREGIDVVRRPTGGRAILHAEELTYSVMIPAGRKDHSSGVQRHRPCARARPATCSGSMSRSSAHSPISGAATGNRPPFPASPAPRGMRSSGAGRKLVGSAQRRFSDGEQRGRSPARIDPLRSRASAACGSPDRRRSGGP